MRLKNKTALITGSARGIGAATAGVFMKEGARVIISDIRDEEGQALAQRMGGETAYIHLDVGAESDWLSAAEYISNTYGRLDVLVNNAGITGFLETSGPWDAENADTDSWDEVHRVNSTGVMLGCKYAIRLMKGHGGSIINISSRSGVVGIPGAVAYAASKAAVRNHTKSVAFTVLKKDIRSGAIVFTLRLS
jgi:3(or 17)beta-hydroxysteroid dehydrogenase